MLSKYQRYLYPLKKCFDDADIGSYVEVLLNFEFLSEAGESQIARNKYNEIFYLRIHSQLLDFDHESFSPFISLPFLNLLFTLLVTTKTRGAL